jgi:hypothetical protein
MILAVDFSSSNKDFHENGTYENVIRSIFDAL